MDSINHFISLDGDAFIRKLAENAPSYREDFMTIAEQLEAKGEARGYQLGQQDTTRQLAKQFLANGVDRSVIKASTGLSDEELDALLN